MIALLAPAAGEGGAPPGAVLFDPGAGEILAGARRIALTPGEAAVLGALERAGGACLSARELAWRLYGDRDVHGEKLVQIHVMKLRRKLAGVPAALETRRGFGYRLRGAPP